MLFTCSSTLFSIALDLWLMLNEFKYLIYRHVYLNSLSFTDFKVLKNKTHYVFLNQDLCKIQSIFKNISIHKIYELKRIFARKE
jgi:hypothetical protein